MRLIKFICAAGFTVAFIYILNTHGAFGQSQLPAFGKWLDPFGGFWNNAQTENGFKHEDLDFEGLSGPVKVLYDNRMVPHIFAENEGDALFVQGYLEARHRLWQMDLTARSAAGTLSEVFGERTVEIDRLQRRKGVTWAAEKAVTGWVETAGPRLDTFLKYIDGINAYIDQLDEKTMPIEFKLLGYKPAQWSAYKSALISKRMAQTLCSREDDLETSNALKELGEETFNFLFPAYNPQQSPIITDDYLPGSRDSLSGIMSEMIGHTYQRPEPQAPKFIGSNNWAVAGSKTANGYPILCNDPHLQLTLPAIWFEVQMHTPNYNAYGVSIPGFPGIMIGFNEHIAWGETNGSQDVLDWHEIDWTNDAHTEYRFDGTVHQVEYRTETIKIKGQDSIIDSVRYTMVGPIVYEATDEESAELAMRWIAHDKPDRFEPATFLDLNKAKNYDEYVAALAHYISPIQNFVFASADGDIGIWVNGRLPIKEQGDGTQVSLADESSDLWTDYIPHDQMPHVRNPASGYVGSANQSSTSPAYPYYYNGSFDDYRGRILHRSLAQMNDITTDDMRALQLNNYSILAEDALPLMLKLLDSTSLNTIQLGLFNLLQNWDFRFDRDSKEAIIFETWWGHFYKDTWDEFYALNENMSMRFPESWRTIDLIQSDPLNVYWDHNDTPEREGPTEIAMGAFAKMYEDIKPYLEKTDYAWGKHATATINHMARIEQFSKFGLETGGYGSALNAQRNSAGPSWRMVVELGPKIKAYGIYPGGQSSNPGSPYFDQMVEDWAAGAYYELDFLYNPEEAGEEYWLEQTFNPAHKGHNH